MLALDEILPGALALLVALDHRQLFCHIKRDRIFNTEPAISRSPVLGSGRYLKKNVIPVRDKPVLIDARFDPCREVLADLEKRMQLAGTDGLNGRAADG